MHSILIPLLAASSLVVLPVIGVPTGDVQRRNTITLSDGMIITTGENAPDQEKRNIQGPNDDPTRRSVTLSDGMTITIGNSSTVQESKRDALEKRNSDYVSSCGPKSGWIPINDHYSGGGTEWWGYSSTIDAICTSLSSDLDGNPVIVGAGQYAAGIRRYQIESSQTGFRVALKNEIPGHIEFEIHNKQSEAEHRVDHDSCVSYLMEMTDPNANGENCYGSVNHDTKGGTWQIGDNKISYHALPASN